jgi:ketosteroid isomerase-like protein
MAKSAEQITQELLDREKIRELTAKYCFYVMTRQRSKVPDLFVDDASFTGNAGAPANGKEALRKMFSASESLTLIPFIHNHLIELSDNRASGTCAVEVRAVQNGVAMTAAGYYTDQYVKVNDEWKFQSRDLRLFHFVPLEKGWAVEDGKVELGQR